MLVGAAEIGVREVRVAPVADVVAVAGVARAAVATDVGEDTEVRCSVSCSTLRPSRGASLGFLLHQYRGAAGEDLAHAFDLGAHAPELFLNMLIATVDVVHAINDGFTISHQCGQDERS
jgi:hypothetical protein